MFLATSLYILAGIGAACVGATIVLVVICWQIDRSGVYSDLDE